MNQYRRYTNYNNLKVVMVGSYFYPEFFSKIKNDHIKTPLMQTAQEINEDLENLEKVLKSYDIKVLRAPQPTGYFDVADPYKSPLQVRNHHAVIGQHLYQFNTDFRNPLTPVFKNYCADIIDFSQDNNAFFKLSMSNSQENYNPIKDVWFSKKKYNALKGSSWPEYKNFVSGNYIVGKDIQQELNSFKRVLEYETKEVNEIEGPNVVLSTENIFVDCNEYCDYQSFLKNILKDGRDIKTFNTGAGHTDGVFAVLNDNLILTVDRTVIDFNQHFPGADIIEIPYDSYKNICDEWKIMKAKVSGSWWVPGQEYNNEFIEFVENQLKAWTGFVEETVFDVNLLSVNPNLVLCSNITNEVRILLKSKKVECELVPWRHRFFVDGGLHCITLDLYRE